MINPLKQVAANRTGLCLAAASVLFVVGWRLCIIARQPAHWLAFATEIGSVTQKGVTQSGNIFPNQDGTRLIYEQETEKGLGTFFWDAATGKSELLLEQKQADTADWRTKMLGWSPDDSLFVCIARADLGPGMSTAEFRLYDGNTGEITAKTPADGYAAYSQFTWLSPRSFAYSSGNQTLAVVEKKSDGAWAQSRFFEQQLAGPKWQGLKSFSPQSVVWQEGHVIWEFNFLSESKIRLWDSTTNRVESFICTTDRDLLLRCPTTNGLDWILFAPPGVSANPKGTILSVTPNEKRVRRAEMHENQGVYSFTVRTNLNAEPVHFTWEGKVERWKLSGTSVFFSGNRPNEPNGVWVYDVVESSATCLTPALKVNSRYGTIVTPISGTGTNAQGKVVRYRVWEPVCKFPGKQSPLILGETHNEWSAVQQVAANAGYYFATVDRPSWNEGRDDWAEDVPWLYRIVTQNPNIDTNHVYLFGISAETSYLSQVAAERPDSWKGAILFDPTDLPNLSVAHLSKIFIVDGEKDGDAIKRLTKYQDDAAVAGVPVRLALVNGAGHIAKSMATEREQIKQFARFLVEN